MTLTPQQKTVVECPDPRICVIAGPGSGKTRAVIERVKARNLPGRNVVLFTFTNAGAKELKARLGDYKPRYIGTIHGFCGRLLQKFGHLIGYRQGIGIVSEETTERMLLAIRDELGLRRFSDKKVFERAPGTELIWQKYHHDLISSNSIDYDKILVDAGKLMHLAPVQESMLDIRDLYVDEAQDSGEADWAIINAFPEHVTRMIIGDLDQSIYGFRGGRPALMLAFAKTVTTLPIEDCFRCDIAICDTANELISHNPRPFGKVMKPVTEELGSVTRKWCDSEQQEIRYVVNAVDQEPDKSEVAVLARTNAIARQFMDALKDAGIAVRQRIFVRPPEDWKAACALVGLLVNPGNELLVEEYLVAMQRGSELSRLKLQAIATERPLSKIAGVFPECLTVHPASVTSVLAKKGIGQESLAIISRQIDLLIEPTLGDVQESLRHAFDTETGDARTGVTVGTAHSAKGCEWDSVFCVALEEGVWPQLRQDSDPEEERRLAFVAFTRARHRLTLSGSAKRSNGFGPAKAMKQSRFMA